ncbi:MAG: phasin family protein [Burkholderiales bacterium]|nr:phasin family protein [Burkholderiales bacterium]
MLKQAKAKAKSESTGASGAHDALSDLPKSILDSSRQIWLAGLGAFSKAQAGGMKVFETLVEQGEVLEKKTRHVAADAAAVARGAARAKAKEVQAMAGGTWDKLEQVFEDRVARALSKLGVHTQSDVERLAERVDALSEAVNELLKATGVEPKRKAPASPVKKIVKGAVKTAARSASTAARTASGAVDAATRTASGAVGAATRTAKRTVRTARKVVKGALG